MFPSFTSLSQRESKRQELLRQAEKELAIERQLDQRYAEAMWAADNESGLLVYPKPTNGTDTQTDLTIPPSATTGVQAGVPVATASASVGADAMSVDTGVFSRVDAALSDAPAVAAPMSPPSTASDQNIAKQRVRLLLAKFPELAMDKIRPEYMYGSNFQKMTAYFNKDMELRNKTSGLAQKDADARMQLINWVSTLSQIEDRLKAKGMLPKTVNADAAFSGMVPVPGNAPPPAVVPPVVDEKKREALEKLDAIVTRRSNDKAMTALKSGLSIGGPTRTILKHLAMVESAHKLSY
jgi:hypothetical protein